MTQIIVSFSALLFGEPKYFKNKCGNFIRNEYLLTLHLKSKLPDEIIDFQAGFDERTGPPTAEKEIGEEYWHMDEPISREKADLLCRSVSLAFSGVNLIVSIVSVKLYVIINLEF